MIKIEKTTYEVDGLKEPCYLVTNGYAVVRIAKCYHLIGRNTLTVTTFLEDEWNGEEEITGDFDELTFMEVRRIAKENCVYMH